MTSSKAQAYRESDANVSLPRRIRPSRIKESDKDVCRYVVIGGGIAGVCCAQELARINYSQEIILISGTDVLKESKGVMKVTNYLEEISVYERRADVFQLDNPNITVVRGIVAQLKTALKLILLEDGRSIAYDKVCICSGAKPHLIANHRNIIGIRDLESVHDLTKRLSLARNVVVLGNGGIALEAIHMLQFCNVDWIVKDDYIGSTFLDASASSFLLPRLGERIAATAIPAANIHVKEQHYQQGIDTDIPEKIAKNSSNIGAALGPEWLLKSGLVESLPEVVSNRKGQLKIHVGREVIAYRESKTIKPSSSDEVSWKRILSEEQLEVDNQPTLSSTAEELLANNGASITSLDEFPLYILDNRGSVIGCDFIISATGVSPMTSFLNGEETLLDKDGAIVVGDDMASNCLDVYAAGDCCSYRCLNLNDGSHHDALDHDAKDPCTSNGQHISTWFQMKLWSQARSMGVYAAQCMSGYKEDLGGGFFFELFAHVTRIFDFKVVLLGCFNAQGFGNIAEAAVKNFSVSDRLSSQDNSTVSHLEVWMRVTPGVEYIKLVVWKGKLVGAMLIGNTDLEETMENLILNKVDLTDIGINLLDPEIDIEDFFD